MHTLKATSQLALLMAALLLIPCFARGQQVRVASATPSEAPQGAISPDVAVEGIDFNGKGTSLFAVQGKANDPCAAAVNFPSFVFNTINGQGATHVSDRTGKCTRLLKSGLPSLHRVFSYPVIDDAGNATNRGRVVWMGPDPGQVNTPDVEFHAMDFVVAGAAITPGPVYLVVNFGPVSQEGGGNGGVCCGLDLSVDGRDLYLPTKAELRAEGYVNKVVRMRLPANLADLDPEVPPSQITVFEHAASPRNDTEYGTDLDVNAANDYLYIRQKYGQNAGTRVLRVDLDPDMSDTAGNPEAAIVAEPLWGGSSVFVGADVSNPASDLLAVVFAPTAGACQRLTIMNGRTGTVLNEGTDWPAHWVSWANGKVLTRGFRSGCRALDNIVQVDPLSGQVTTLVNGVNPDGR